MLIVFRKDPVNNSTVSYVVLYWLTLIIYLVSQLKLFFIFNTGNVCSIFSQTEKFICDELEYIRAIYSARELYDNQLTKNCDDLCDLSIIFQSLSNVANECGCLVNNVSTN